jgi:hypothetical protein
MLIVAPVPPALHGTKLSKFLLPIAKYVGFNTTKLTHLTYGEVALGGDNGERGLHANIN